MIRKVKLRPRAVEDLDDIWTYTVDTWSEVQAVDYLSGMDAALKLLTEFPEMARLRQEFTPPIRIHPYRKHLIIYIADDGFIDVVRVVHAQANWSAVLTE